MVFAASHAANLCALLSMVLTLRASGNGARDLTMLRVALLLRWSSIIACAIYMDEERRVTELWD